MGELTAKKRTNHYPVEISGSWYHFGRNWSRNRTLKNGRISGQPELDIRYIPTYFCISLAFAVSFSTGYVCSGL